MSKDPVFISVLGPHISAFLAEKRSCGYAYKRAGDVLARLDRYWFAHGYLETYLTKEAIEGWCIPGAHEGIRNLLDRLSLTREFSKYLCGLGYSSFIPPIECREEVLVREPLQDEELAELFWQIDHLELKARPAETFCRLSNEYPVLFRGLYHLGMRVNELCSLPLSQYDQENGIITVLDGKNNKDRLVYLADDLNVLFINYLGYLRRVLGEEPVWLFPGRDPECHISTCSVERIFNKCWTKTSFAASRNMKPTPHDLRHTFITKKIDQWAAKGLSFGEMRPYLSQYVGHKTFSNTLYYYHLSKQACENIQSHEKTIKNIIPEVRRI